MSAAKVYPVPVDRADASRIDAERYAAMYARSIEDPDAFWSEQAERFVDWFRPWDAVQRSDFHKGEIGWFVGAKLNVAYNCLDRHLEEHGARTAIVWEGDDPADVRQLSYEALHAEVCRFANALRGIGVKKGDRVCIYMPMIPEAAVAMLASARIGAIHCVVFGGFSPDALRDRIDDSGCSVVVTAEYGLRGGRRLPLKANADRACEGAASVKRMVVVRRGEDGADEEIDWRDGRDLWYHELVASAAEDCPAVEMDAEDTLFVLYTSGSGGTPKGLVHGSGGYLLYAAMTYRYVFDHREGEVHWCTADLGWITGHSYGLYGPLANGATTLMFEGLPTAPDPGRYWDIVDRHRVAVLYTAPTVLRALMAHGEAPLERSERDSLRLLGTVGEPIDAETWEWYHRAVGRGRCAVVDTWWQTETGGIVLAPLPGATALKPGSAGKPFFGIEPALIDADGAELEGEARGALVITRSWPGQARGIHGDPGRFRETYFARYPGYYFTGDGARRDADGHWWLTGHLDDVLELDGRRFGTVEIESALIAHEAVAEAAVVAAPDAEGIRRVHAYVTLMHGREPDAALAETLVARVRDTVDPIAAPARVHWARGLPKTRSGKIMRRILRRIAANEIDQLGDTSTLADAGVVDALVAGRDGV